MSKDDTLGGVQEQIQGQVQKEIENVVVVVAQEILNDIQKQTEALTKEQTTKVQDAFNKAVEGFEGQAKDGVEKTKDQIGQKLDAGLDATGLSREATDNLKKAGHEVIDKVADAALNAITGTAIDSKEAMVKCVQSITAAIGNVFKAIGQVITKETTVEQARESIVQGFKTAGQEVSSTAKGTANSFVERLGLSSKKDKDVSHAERVTAEKNAPPTQDKGR